MPNTSPYQFYSKINEKQKQNGLLYRNSIKKQIHKMEIYSFIPLYECILILYLYKYWINFGYI